MKHESSRPDSYDAIAGSAMREQNEPEDIHIQDLSELPDYDKVVGLSDEQVSYIAQDQLDQGGANNDHPFRTIPQAF